MFDSLRGLSSGSSSDRDPEEKSVASSHRSYQLGPPDVFLSSLAPTPYQGFVLMEGGSPISAFLLGPGAFPKVKGISGGGV